MMNSGGGGSSGYDYSGSSSSNNNFYGGTVAGDHTSKNSNLVNGTSLRAFPLQQQQAISQHPQHHHHHQQHQQYGYNNSIDSSNNYHHLPNAHNTTAVDNHNPHHHQQQHHSYLPEISTAATAAGCYDHTNNSNPSTTTEAQQHQLVMAYLAANYDSSASTTATAATTTPQHQPHLFPTLAQQQQQHPYDSLQQQHHHHLLGSNNNNNNTPQQQEQSDAATMRALLGESFAASTNLNNLGNTINPGGAHHHHHTHHPSSSNTNHGNSASLTAAAVGGTLSPLLFSQQQPASHDPRRAAALLSSFSRSGSFDDLFFLADPTIIQNNNNSNAAGLDAMPDFAPPPFHSYDQQPPPLMLSSSDNNSPMAAFSGINPALLAILQQQQYPPPEPEPEPWLTEIQLTVASISLEPLSGSVVLDRVQEKLNQVVTKYIPCVDFLVQCQQDLRKGLEMANHQNNIAASLSNRRYRSSNSRAGGITASQFYKAHVEPLSRSFYSKQLNRMEQSALNDALVGLDDLQLQAKNVERQGLEAVKNTFLGGMKDGESWGLRKWLSKHGGALVICTDLECILNASKKLDRNSESTKKLAKLLRPMAKQVLDKLHSDIPTSYQQRSSAHPYLPFFHRLEDTLKGMSMFDPEEDDVICIDTDSEDDDVVPLEAASSYVKQQHQQPQQVQVKQQQKQQWNAATKKRMEPTLAPVDVALASAKRPKDAPTRNGYKNGDDNDNDNPVLLDDDSSSSGESVCESIIEIIDASNLSLSTKASGSRASGGAEDQNWICPSCCMVNAAIGNSCVSCGEENLLKEIGTIFGLDDLFEKTRTSPSFDTGFLPEAGDTETSSRKFVRPKTLPWPIPIDQPELYKRKARTIADRLDNLADVFDRNQQASVPEILNDEASLWNGEIYGRALHLFANLLRKPGASFFLEPVDDEQLMQMGYHPLYCHVVKHPVSFCEIAGALLGHDLKLGVGNNGSLCTDSLSSLNMWNGRDLLQTIDLVFLNDMAFADALKLGKSPHRSMTNLLRKFLWSGIADFMSSLDPVRRKQNHPVRRSEKSGFVVFKQTLNSDV